MTQLPHHLPELPALRRVIGDLAYDTADASLLVYDRDDYSDAVGALLVTVRPNQRPLNGLPSAGRIWSRKSSAGCPRRARGSLTSRSTAPAELRRLPTTATASSAGFARSA